MPDDFFEWVDAHQFLPGRFVTRDELASLCDFAVWLPTNLPPDLRDATYVVAGYDDRPHARYEMALQGPSLQRALSIVGNRIGDYPTPRSWRRRLGVSANLDGTHVRVYAPWPAAIARDEWLAMRESFVRLD